jgi:hypothetical protein
LAGRLDVALTFVDKRLIGGGQVEQGIAALKEIQTYLAPGIFPLQEKIITELLEKSDKRQT